MRGGNISLNTGNVSSKKVNLESVNQGNRKISRAYNDDNKNNDFRNTLKNTIKDSREKYEDKIDRDMGKTNDNNSKVDMEKCDKSIEPLKPKGEESFGVKEESICDDIVLEQEPCDDIYSKIIDYIESSMEDSQSNQMVDLNNLCLELEKELNSLDIDDLKKMICSLFDIKSMTQIDNIKSPIFDLNQGMTGEAINLDDLSHKQLIDEIITEIKNVLSGNDLSDEAMMSFTSNLKELSNEFKIKAKDEKASIMNSNINNIEEADNKAVIHNSSENSNEATLKQFNDKDSNSSNFKENTKEDELLNKIASNDNNDNNINLNARSTFRFSDVLGENKISAPVINKGTMSQDIIKAVKFMQTNEIKELAVKINPGKLGEMIIKVINDGNTLKAEIQATNKDTMNLINSQEIKNALSNSDIKISQVDISLYNEDTTFFNNHNNHESNSNRQNNRSRAFGEYDEEEINLNDDSTALDGIQRLNIFV